MAAPKEACDPVTGVCKVEKLSIDDPVEAKVDDDKPAANAEGAKLLKFLGEKIVGKDGKEVETKSLLSKDAVGLYFSAHWCPPCRGFTPKFATVYNDLKKAGKSVEVVFVSSDRSENDFKDYYKDMPWLALPYNERNMKEKLSRKFGVSGIPSLIFINPKTFQTLTTSGREFVMKDPKGEKFPWKDPTMKETMTEKLEIMTKDGTTTMGELMEKNKYLILYFSAHWCPPCKGFTPKFAEWYKNNQKKKEGTDQAFDVLFVSSDHDKDGFEGYFKDMPWKALPYQGKDGKGRDRKNFLSKTFGIQGIPSVVVVDKDLNMITDKGRKGVMTDKDAEKFPWIPEIIVDFDEEPDDVNGHPSIFFNLEGASEEDKKKKLAILKKAAEARKAECEKEDERLDLRFFYLTATKDQTPGGQIKKYCKLTKEVTVLVVNFPKHQYKLYKSEDQCTEAGLNAVIKDLVNDKLEMEKF